MKIRIFNIADYDDVYALWMRTPNMGLNNVDDSREGIGKYLKRNPHTSFVAELDGKIIGVIMCGDDGRRGYIHHACVDVCHRNNGIGTQLVEAAMAALKNIGITKVALVAFGYNEGGNAFWEKIGFTSRSDLVYRNKALVELVRIDT
ncbi:MAG: GNAT family N-acetyltransferase [Defluviitaleaceae bacterium]|nr:GNAT family N-acetyltransferase [Defluviitaleaceae bacterium]MCL2836556.1 GNAT family N-acetyltransferase [Defluviitaleaceae bacterium]